jgi:predicted nucleic acid-binding Zn finger protein
MSVFTRLTEAGRLTVEITAELESLFGNRFTSAIRYVQKRQLTRFIFQPSGMPVWVAYGDDRDYLLIPPHYCQCLDFHIGYMKSKGREPHARLFCKHLLAQHIAAALGVYDARTIPDSDVQSFWDAFL